MRSKTKLWRTFCVLIVAHGTCAAQNPQAPSQKQSDDQQSRQKVRIEIDDDQQISVKAKIDPVEFVQHEWHANWDTLDNLRAAHDTQEYDASVLRAFLPVAAVSVGDMWKVQPTAVKLLKQLHEGASMNLHINPHAEGGWAIVRAVNPQWVEIAFRVHGQFVLKDGWFTPSQFAGRIVIDRHSGKVEYFRMHVPQDTLNFDVGRKLPVSIPGVAADDVVDAGAGYCPRIELVAGNSAVTNGVQWTEVLNAEQTKHKLALQFYPAWKIDWVPWKDALAKARQLKKPLHIVSADGPFKDEAC